MPEERVCAACGRHVWADDRYCPGCGVAFGGVRGRAEGRPTLPGFDYHFVQGLGWGLGLAVASVIASIIMLLLIVLATHGIR